jgi:N-acetylmuramoyl-L-alanine amidase
MKVRLILIAKIIFLNIIFSNCYGKLVKTQAKVMTRINSIRVWPSPGNVRVVFDLSDDPKYKVDSLINPHRIVIDFSDANLSTKLASDLNKQQLKTNTNNLKKIFTIHNKNSVKVVLELNDLLLTHNFVLKPNERYGHRLVLDLESSEKQKILALFDLNQLKTIEQFAKGSQIDAKNKLIVAIDPGHGGEDPGAIGRNGTLEKNIVLSIARILKTEINNSKHIRAFLTRDGDYYVSLQDRMLRARNNKADLFISIHADAFTNSNADGASVFVLSERGESSAAAKWLAESQNKSDVIGGVTIDNKDNVLASVIFDLSQKATSKYSFNAAKNILFSMKYNTNLHKNYIQRANFLVLKSPDVPSILIEIGFISNHKTELKLRDNNYQKKIAHSISNGIQNYFSSQPKKL